MARYKCHYKHCAVCLICSCFLLWIIPKYILFSVSTRKNEFSDSRIVAISHIPAQIQETCIDRKLTLSGRPLPLIAIASFPESGAEWVQDLLQKVTGIVTGNVYCKDPADHFFENCLRNRRVLTVRTHDTWIDNGRYDKAVIIIRSPYTAITAEFKSYLKRNDKKHPLSSKQYKDEFSRFIWRSGEKWILTYDSWLKFTGEKEILFYDELLSNPADMILTIMKFADIKETDLKLNCFEEVSWKPVNQTTPSHAQLAMFTIDFRKKIEKKIVEFENRISKIKNYTFSLQRDV